ncbi:15861_t:CDS:10 [Gigaspora margarita]|uniref:15861_t:CDS:1 n=1 Tax=Gigaspora margarita TaxID=4874 RepID=A0ABM8W1N6_GIGMA|nr:15861_t:CDS:10 [Gigaspora margarita]
MDLTQEGTSVDIDVNAVRDLYNSPGPIDLKPIWDKCLEKLNEYVVQIKRLGSDFEIPSELRNSKLSTFVKKHNNFKSLDPINVNNSDATFQDVMQLPMPDQLMQAKIFGDIGIASIHNDVSSRDNIISVNRVDDNKVNNNISLPDLIILDENDIPSVKHSTSQSFKKSKKSCAKLTNNQCLTNQCVQPRIYNEPVKNKAYILPMKRSAPAVLNHYTIVHTKLPSHRLDKKFRGEKYRSQVESFDEDKNISLEYSASGSKSNPISLVSSDEEDDVLTSSSLTRAVTKQKVAQPFGVKSHKRIDFSNSKAQELDTMIIPQKVESKNPSTQKVQKSTQNPRLEVQSVSLQDIEIKTMIQYLQLYFKHDKEQDVAKKLLFEKRDYKIKTAMEQEDCLDDPSYDIDNAMTIISYMALNDLSDNPQTVVHRLNQLKSYDFKCGSGDVNEIALNCSNTSTPIIAMGYIANTDPDYNYPGNLQFLDVKQGAIYNLWGHVEQDLSSKSDVWTTVTDVKFSPDGKFIFSASTDASIKVWQTGDANSYLKPLHTKVCQSKIHRLSVCKKPTYGTKYQLASCEDSGLAQVHFVRIDKKQGFTMLSQEFIEENCKRVSSDINFISSNKVVAGYYGSSNDPNGVIKVWDINSRKKTCYSKQPITGSVSCLDVSYDEKWITCGTTAGFEDKEGDGSMHIWDMLSSTTLCAYTGERDINVISISPNDQYIALGGMMNTVYVYDKRYLNQSLHVLKHENPDDGLPHDGIMSLQWILDSNILVSGGNDNCVKIWDVSLASDNNMIYQFSHHDSPVTSIKIASDLSLLTVGVSSGKMYVYSSDETFIQAGNRLKYL